jgi:integrase/recombinase XerD
MEVATNPAASSKGWPVSALAPLLQAFFTERLARQRDASPHTTASYRDSFRLLLEFLHEQIGKSPAKLQLEDLDAARITAFLSYLENERGNSVRTRNARLTAIHSFFHFAALKAPECAEQIARVLAIPDKRYASTLISYLTEPEIDALLTAPDRSTPTGRRDHALLLLAVQTGLRASELASLRRQDLNLSSGWVRCEGKGRKERCTPFSRAARQVLRAWLRELGAEPDSPLFPNPSGRHLTRSGIWRLVAGRQEHHPAHAAPHRSDAAAARPRPGGRRNDRAVARARVARLHQQVPARGHGTQATRARPHHTHQRQTRALPRARSATRVPREPLTPRKTCRADEPDLHRFTRPHAAPQHISLRNIEGEGAQVAGLLSIVRYA